MIKSFDCSETQKVFQGASSAKFGNLCRVCQRKLLMLDAARSLAELSMLPGNRLEPLKHTRPGWHSIRVNDRWRICFIWQDGARRVEIVDYH